MLSVEDSIMLKSCMKRLSEKLKLVQKENQRVQFERYQEALKFQKRLDEANQKIFQLKSQNKSLNNKLLQAVEVIKMS